MHSVAGRNAYAPLKKIFFYPLDNPLAGVVLYAPFHANTQCDASTRRLQHGEGDARK